MSITSYYADINIEHSFFGKARMGSIEPLANLCHKVVEDRNYTEAEHVKLIEIVHTTLNRFIEKYPKTQARTVVIRLFVGSSLKSLKLCAEGSFATEYAYFGRSRPTGDTLVVETDLFKQEYIQYCKDLLDTKLDTKSKENEKAQSFWTDLLVDEVANKGPLDVKQEFIEPNSAMFAQQIQRYIYTKLVDRVADLITPKLLNIQEKTGIVHLELKVADKAIVDFLNGIEAVEGK